MAEFGQVLARADAVVLTDIYAAGEDADARRHRRGPGRVGARAHPAIVRIVRPLEAIAPAVADIATPGDFIVTLGAGSIGTVGERIVQALQARQEVQS